MAMVPSSGAHSLRSMERAQKNPMSTIPTPSAFNARIRTRHLLLLDALGRSGVLRRAAAELNMTQPTATQLLQQLEESLGVTLFNRQSRGMEPTIFGEVLIRHARSIISDLAYAREELAGLSDGSLGKVSLGAVSGAVPDLVGPAIARLKSEAPMVKIGVQIESSDVLLRALLLGELDLVLGRVVPGFTVDDFRLEALREEPMCFAANAAHRLARREHLEMADLMGETWILQPAGGAVRRSVEFVWQELGFTRLPDILETSSILVTTALLQDTNMIAVIPIDVAEHYASIGITVLPVNAKVRMERLAIITRRNAELSPAVQAFLAVLRIVHAQRRRQRARSDASS